MAGIAKITEVLASAARIATATSDYIEAELYEEAQLFLLVTAKTGSPTSLDVAVQYTYDGGTTFVAPNTAEAFTQVTGATSTQLIKLSNLGDGFRVVGTMAGGSAGNGFTYSVVAVLKGHNFG